MINIYINLSFAFAKKIFVNKISAVKLFPIQLHSNHSLPLLFMIDKFFVGQPEIDAFIIGKQILDLEH